MRCWSTYGGLALLTLVLGCGTAPIESSHSPEEPSVQETSVQLSAVAPTELAAKLEGYQGKVLLLDVWATW